MKKVLLAGSAMIAALTIASAAQAADIAVAPAYDWTGFYLGANAGVAWNNSSLNANGYQDGFRDSDIGNKIDGDQTVFTGGGIVGYNYQIDKIVLGAEADFNYLGFGDSNKRNVDFTAHDLDINYSSRASVDVDWFGTIRGRLGFAIDNVLLYGTGGLAYGHVNADSKFSVSVEGDKIDSWSNSNDETNWGWTVGGGMEYGIDNWSLGLEYLYVDLGDGNWKDNHDGNTFHDYGIKGSADYAFSVVRATAKFRF
ncbi:outer membrane protein [Aestuariivirga sp.]|uniref:outer membrane protein n=1 Tax=Aestuariivirga sp. TaxID=2650926 RepID=UPI003BA91B2B